VSPSCHRVSRVVDALRPASRLGLATVHLILEARVRIDLSAARQTVAELAEELEKLDGLEVDESPTRAGRRDRSALTRSLLRTSHLGDRAAVQIMDVYHDFKLRDDEREGDARRE
jgi:hypothetical protein